MRIIENSSNIACGTVIHAVAEDAAIVEGAALTTLPRVLGIQCHQGQQLGLSLGTMPFFILNSHHGAQLL